MAGLKVVKNIIAGIAIAFALFYLILTLAKKERGVTFASRMIMSCMCVLCGVLVIIVDDSLLEYLLTAFGVLLIVDASFKIQTSILSKKYHSPVWWLILFVAVLVLTSGVLLMKGDFDFSLPEGEVEEVYKNASYLLGIGLVLDGISNLLAIGYLYYVEKGAKKEMMEQLQQEGVVPVVIETLPPEVADAGDAPVTEEVQVTPTSKPKGKGKGTTTPAKPKGKGKTTPQEEVETPIVLPQLEAGSSEEE